VPQLVAIKSHQISAADGTQLHVSDYLLPAAEVRGSVVVMHGFGDHCGRYQHLARFFNDCGLSVRCYDHRGHGRSQGARGDVINGDPMIQDAEIIIEDFAAHFAAPPFLYGESMGGLFAARFALRRLLPLRGLILASPALAVRLSRFQNMLFKVMEVLAPWFAVPVGLSATSLSHDRSVAAAYKSDPLVHGRISARLMRSMLSSMAYCQSYASTLSVPTLVLVAGDDHLVDPEGSKGFFSRLPPGLAQLHVYEGFYHEIFNEVESRKPFADLRSWLEGRILSIR
jgi:alpha-beta hydrolase superfamily lysophospholipase